MDAIQAARPMLPSAMPLPTPPPAIAREAADRVTLGGSEPGARVSLHIPAGDGKFLQVHKFRTSLADVVRPDAGPQGAIFCEDLQGQPSVTRADLEGQVAYRVPMHGETPSQILESADKSRLLVITDQKVHCLDPRDGREIRAIASPDSTHGRQVLPQADGRVALLEGKSLTWFDGDLNETGRTEFTFEPRSLRVIPPQPGIAEVDGGLIVHGSGDYYNLGQVEIRSADGRAVFSSSQVRPSLVAMTSEGLVQVVEYGQHHESHLIEIDPRTGETGRHPVETMARALWALPNGTSMVFDTAEYSSSSFVQYRADGSEGRRLDFDRDYVPRNFLADAAREQAYVVVQGNGETVIHRMDTSVPGPAPTSTLTSEPAETAPTAPLPAGTPSASTVVCRGQGNLIVPPPLPDGRLVVFGPSEITVYGPDGVAQATFGTLQGLRDALGNPTLQENRILGEHPRSERTSLEAWLPVAAKYLPLSDRGTYLDPMPKPGQPSRGADRCMNFARMVDSDTALADMNLPDHSVYQRMTMQQAHASLAVGETPREVLFPGDAARLTVQRERLAVDIPGHETIERKYLDLTAALPVKAGDEYFVALAEGSRGTGRALAWNHPLAQSYEQFDVTSRIVGLYGSEAGAVYAVGANGTVLMVETPLEPGEKLESPVTLPTPMGQLPTASETIVQTEDSVVIAGIRVRRRT